MTQPEDEALQTELDRLRRRVVELEDRQRVLTRRAEEEHQQRVQQQEAFERHRVQMELVQSVAVTANEAPSVAAALRLALDGICTRMGWPVGHAFVVERGSRATLRDGPWYVADPDRYQAFREATQRLARQGGGGIPAAALACRQPCRFVDVTRQADPRAGEAAGSGLEAAFAIPVLVGEEVVAVLEFFGPVSSGRIGALEEVAPLVGAQLGRTIERKRAEDALRYTRMQQQALSRRLLEIQELERSRIARELHDQIGQALTAVKLNIEAAQQDSGDVASADFAEAVAAIDQAIEQVRTLSFELRPAILDDLGLAVAVTSYAKRQAAKAGLDLRLGVEPVGRTVRKEVETACFRIVQEALTNVVRHAGARCVEVTLREVEGVLEVTVGDDGTGFAAPPRGGAPQGGWLGILGMRERAQNVGGAFEVDSRPGAGTRVRARLPLRASDRLERRVAARP